MHHNNIPVPAKSYDGLGRCAISKAYNQAMVGLAYGRHAGPPPRAANQAAVLILFVWDGRGWSIPLTKRPATLRHHAGQVCFPGGRLEPGETSQQAAVREFEEELGVMPDDLKLIGQLRPMHVYASGNLVTPIVACTADRMTFRPDPGEVQEIVHLPWPLPPRRTAWTRQVMKRRVVRDGRLVDSFEFAYNALEVGEHLIWGATAMMLAELAEEGYQIR